MFYHRDTQPHDQNLNNVRKKSFIDQFVPSSHIDFTFHLFIHAFISNLLVYSSSQLFVYDPLCMIIQPHLHKKLHI